MIDHLSTYATDFDATRAFYDAVFPTLGYEFQFEMKLEKDPDMPGRRACAFGPPGRPVFWILETREAFTPRHMAFEAADHDAVRAFHEAGLAAGAPDHGAAGPRPHYGPHYYGSFLLDPDGNNVEAVCHQPTA